MALTTDSVALYWDFENLHAGLVDQAHGQGAYQANRFRPQDEVIEVSALVEYALSIGPIAINRAFANWVSFNRYRQALLQNAVELIQVFPPGANAKNGADIKLCLDVMDDMARFPHISTIIVVGGDSDYMPLSYKVKAAGRTLVGIGSRRSTNQHWARSCHEFKFYETLLAPPPVPAESAAAVLGMGGMSAAAEAAAAATADTAGRAGRATESTVGQPAHPAVQPDLSDQAPALGATGPTAAGEAPGAVPGSTDEMRRLLDLAVQAQQRQRSARELVAKAILRLGQMRGERWIQKARLRPYIQRMDPTFHESSFGFSSFNEMLATMDDLVETRKGEFDHELRLSERAVPAEPPAADLDPAAANAAASAAEPPALHGPDAEPGLADPH